MTQDVNGREDLAQRRCVSCDSKGKPLGQTEIQEYLTKVSHWDLASDGKSISRQYLLRSFAAAVRFINKVAEISETENHHPDIHLVSYRKLQVVFSTHAIGGLSDDDFVMAAKINQLTAP